MTRRGGLISLISLIAQFFSAMKAPAGGLISLFSHKVHSFFGKLCVVRKATGRFRNLRNDVQTLTPARRRKVIKAVRDRLIQQALNQALQPLFDPKFSPSSYGFRAGRHAHQAVQVARGYVAEGKRWVVDLDLEKFLETSSYCPHVHEMLSNRSG
jgi:hypothetical protein